MATTKEFQKSHYPLPAYNFRVTIDSKEFSFSEVSGLSAEYEPVTYRHGFSFAMGEKIIPGMRRPIKLTMKNGIVKGRDKLQEWLRGVYGDPFYLDSKRDIRIDLCDEQGNAVVRWTVKKALPVKMDAPTFDASGNDAAIAAMEVIAHDLEVDYDPQ